ncbi:HEAT repeat domain-containing protein [Streptomyces xanthii]|uniref:PBS lyase n=1 Tax=Streptomyces xanthii TaxID=2768069 RepID=A0A7H1B255_9ACTN|nr:HEAT repeat domain-containing protein [Streptomyces xanthii]QNS02810.1 hypothetical protein IAG42_03675 [Streptomyces xanthii]
MDLVDPLAGLDSFPWDSVSHAYGSADDVPVLLRALTDPDDEAAEDALSELYGSVLHQGTVYTATAAAVPFLARIAAAGHRAGDVLALLGGMAESGDESGMEPGMVRAAVVAQLPLLIPMLDDDSAGVRKAAAWALSHTRAAGEVRDALRARWEPESDPGVRAEVLSGIARLDPEAGAALAAGALTPEQPGVVRLAAVFAHVDTGAAWTGPLHQAMLSVLPAEAVRSEFDEERGEPLASVVEALLDRDQDDAREAAFALIDAAARDGRAEVRAEGLWAAEQACQRSRSAPARLLPALRAAAVDEKTLLGMASLLGSLGPAAAPLADLLVPLAGRNAAEEDDPADRALAALVHVAPEQALPLLTAAFGRRPRAFGAAVGRGIRTDGPVFPYADGLLAAVRARLAHPEDLKGNEPWQLTHLLACWHAAAAPALPELCAALPHHPHQAARAIAAIAPACPAEVRAQVVDPLRTAAEAGSLAAAQAVHTLTGDPTPLLHRLRRELGGGAHEVAAAARIAGELGPRAAELAPALREALSASGSDTTPALDADAAIAEALWRITGDAAEAVAVLDSVLTRAADNAWARWTVVRAARAARSLGPAARPLAPHLEAALDDPVRAPAAAAALAAAAGPGSPARDALAEAALRSAELGADPDGACEALEALGRDALTPGQVRRATVLADGDRRVVLSGVVDEFIRRDEALRARIGAFLTT